MNSIGSTKAWNDKASHYFKLVYFHENIKILLNFPKNCENIWNLGCKLLTKNSLKYINNVIFVVVTFLFLIATVTLLLLKAPGINRKFTVNKNKNYWIKFFTKTQNDF